MPLFHDPNTKASLPAGITLQPWVFLPNHPVGVVFTLLLLYPVLKGLHGIDEAFWVGTVMVLVLNGVYWKTAFEKWRHGDVCPALVVSDNPGLIAVATNMSRDGGEHYVVKIIRCSLNGLPERPLSVKSRLATVANYDTQDESGLARTWDAFYPEPCGWATADQGAIGRVRRSLTDRDWVLLETLLEFVPKPYKPGGDHEGNYHIPTDKVHARMRVNRERQVEQTNSEPSSSALEPISGRLHKPRTPSQELALEPNRRRRADASDSSNVVGQLGQ